VVTASRGVCNTIVGMTATHDTADAISTRGAGDAGGSARGISVLLYSSDRAVRDAVRVGVGDRPADDVTIERWHECATSDAVLMAVRDDSFDVLVLDGEAQPYGGMGISRQLKNEIFQCPPILLLTGRPVDGWLATWSLADAAVPRPLDPRRLSTAVADLARR
jgi:DNA-binding response OmpR family regulator